jgi:hypothetical protein
MSDDEVATLPQLPYMRRASNSGEKDADLFHYSRLQPIANNFDLHMHQNLIHPNDYEQIKYILSQREREVTLKRVIFFFNIFT